MAGAVNRWHLASRENSIVATFLDGCLPVRTARLDMSDTLMVEGSKASGRKEKNDDEQTAGDNDILFDRFHVILIRLNNCATEIVSQQHGKLKVGFPQFLKLREVGTAFRNFAISSLSEIF